MIGGIEMSESGLAVREIDWTLEMSIRRDLCMRNGITIDGKPAMIYGEYAAYPYVEALDKSVSANFTWGTVKRIAENGGSFYSNGNNRG